jgi:hypothetical protein
MENIPDPKYKIGDLVVALRTNSYSQEIIENADYELKERKWRYNSVFFSPSSGFTEDQIIKKLN